MRNFKEGDLIRLSRDTDKSDWGLDDIENRYTKTYVVHIDNDKIYPYFLTTDGTSITWSLDVAFLRKHFKHLKVNWKKRMENGRY